MKYQIASLAVLALLAPSTNATVYKGQSMIELATEDDKIDAGQSEWNDVGYIQTTKKEGAEEPEDESNISISSLNK